MGVGINAYSKMGLLSVDELDDDAHWEEGHQRADLVASEFAQSLAGLEADRWYAPLEGSESAEIMYRSYSGYNRWRALLCQSVLTVEPAVVWDDPEAFKDRPFFELINFSDCEGTIGPVAAAALLADFEDPTNRAAYAAQADASEMATYDRWIDGLKLAADSGLVNFS